MSAPIITTRVFSPEDVSRIKDLLNQIRFPRVQYTGDSFGMAEEALSMTKCAAYELINILAFDDVVEVK